jgi:hypothetical protein
MATLQKIVYTYWTLAGRRVPAGTPGAVKEQTENSLIGIETVSGIFPHKDSCCICRSAGAFAFSVSKSGYMAAVPSFIIPLDVWPHHFVVIRFAHRKCAVEPTAVARHGVQIEVFVVEAGLDRHLEPPFPRSIHAGP